MRLLGIHRLALATQIPDAVVVRCGANVGIVYPVPRNGQRHRDGYDVGWHAELITSIDRDPAGVLRFWRSAVARGVKTRREAVSAIATAQP